MEAKQRNFEERSAIAVAGLASAVVDATAHLQRQREELAELSQRSASLESHIFEPFERVVRVAETIVAAAHRTAVFGGTLMLSLSLFGAASVVLLVVGWSLCCTCRSKSLGSKPNSLAAVRRSFSVPVTVIGDGRRSDADVGYSVRGRSLIRTAPVRRRSLSRRK